MDAHQLASAYAQMAIERDVIRRYVEDGRRGWHCDKDDHSDCNHQVDADACAEALYPQMGQWLPETMP